MAHNHVPFRESVVETAQHALETLLEDGDMRLLNLWAARGGSKTMLLRQLGDSLGTVAESSVLGLWDLESGDLAQVQSEILSAVEAAESAKKIVLLDNLDALLRCDEGVAFFNFEEETVQCLVEREDVLIIATSEIELRQWHEYDVRAAQESYRIPPLTEAEVASLATEWSISPEHAFELTLGHPQALEWLRAQPDISKEELAAKSQVYFLEGLSEACRRLALAACMLPSFDVAVLRRVLPSNQTESSVEESEFESTGMYMDYFNQIRELMGAGLVAWDVESGAYRFTDGAIRRLLARSVRLSRPETFDRIHREAADYYSAEARHAAYLHYSLVNAIYHQAQAHRSEGRPKVARRCVAWVRANLKSWMGASWDAVNEAWQTGIDDDSLRKEIQVLIGTDAFAEIAQLLETGTRSLIREDKNES
jgi:hypothetical protein